MLLTFGAAVNNIPRETCSFRFEVSGRASLWFLAAPLTCFAGPQGGNASPVGTLPINTQGEGAFISPGLAISALAPEDGLRANPRRRLRHAPSPKPPLPHAALNQASGAQGQGGMAPNRRIHGTRPHEAFMESSTSPSVRPQERRASGEAAD